MSILPAEVDTDFLLSNAVRSRRGTASNGAGPLRGDHRGRTIKSMGRAHVEMIEMRVGKKHDVNLGEFSNGQCGCGQAFGSDRKTGQPDSDPRKKNWISENLYPEKID